MSGRCGGWSGDWDGGTEWKLECLAHWMGAREREAEVWQREVGIHGGVLAPPPEIPAYATEHALFSLHREYFTDTSVLSLPLDMPETPEVHSGPEENQFFTNMLGPPSFDSP